MKACDLCGSMSYVLYARKGAYDIVRCNNCHLVYLNMSPDIEFLQQLYTRDYYTNSRGLAKTNGYPDYFALEPALRLSFRNKLVKLKRLCSTGRLLDIGCGPGFFLDEASKVFDVVGIELSAFAARYARSRFKFQVLTGTLEASPFEDESFDVITLWDTIEHLVSPHQTLAKSAHLLKPGGILALQTGDVDSLFAKATGTRWHLFNVPEHLYYFSKNTCQRLLNASGFQVIRCSYESSFYSLSHALDRLMTMIGMTKRPNAGFLDRAIMPFNLLDIMTVYATRIAS